MELSLRLEIAETTLKQEYHWLISQNPVLSVFPTALDLVAHLHHHEEQNRNPSPDQVLLRLVDTHRPLTSNLLQPLLLLVFIPTIHRTTSQVVAIFPSVARDDIAQHLIAALLEFLESKELLSRRSYFAFAVARKLRRCAFRWAIRESRAAVADDPPDQMAVKPESCNNKNGFHSEILLHQFFDDCQRRGWLRFSTLIVLPENEEILDFTTGDKEFWIINGAHNLCYIHPAQTGIRSNLNLITAAGHVYSFLLTEISNDPNAEPDLKLFIEPKESSGVSANTALQGYIRAGEAEAYKKELETLRSETDKQIREAQAQVADQISKFNANYQAKLHFDYSLSAKAAQDPFLVSAIYHDENFTYIQCGAHEKPTLYEMKDGKPNLINF